jgi:beta-lactamase class A
VIDQRSADVATERGSQLDRIRRNAEAEIARIAARSNGVIGVAAVHTTTGLSLAVNDALLFPMASTVKVPIAIAALAKIARGDGSLATMLSVEPKEMNPTGPIGDEFLHPGVSLSVANLLQPMITRSDNTATDIVLRFVGGQSAVRSYLDEVGVPEVNPVRTVREILAVLFGIQPAPDQSMRDAVRGLSADEKKALETRRQTLNLPYIEDERDQATPRGMLSLLLKLWNSDGIPPSVRDTLLPIMRSTTTGLRRIVARLPNGVTVADKTGTASGTANDVGFVTLPDDAGTVALVIFLKASPLPIAEREDVVADVARTIYDAFLLTR